MAEKVNPKHVGYRIREIRKNTLGLSMAAFAKKIDDKSKSGTVSNWETGKNLPNNERLKIIAELGKISVDELLYGSESEQRVREIYKKWDSDSKEKIFNYAHNDLEKSSSLDSTTISKSIQLVEEYSDNENFIGQFQTLTILFINHKEEIEQANDTELKELKETFQDKLSLMIDSIKSKFEK